MAPRRGGGGGDGSGGDGSSSSSSSCGTLGPYPCTSELVFMYGNRDSPLYSDGETDALLALACLWAAALLALFALSLVSAHGVKLKKILVLPVQAAIALLFAGFAFLCIRYGLIVGGIDVAVGYRYEASVAVLLWQLGLATLFAAVFARLELLKGRILTLLSKVVFWTGWAVYALLAVAYIALDFFVATDALAQFRDTGVWILGDRDFALTMDKDMIEKLKTGFSPAYVEQRMWKGDDGATYMRYRDAQIKVGVALAVLGFVLGLVLLASAVLSFLSGRRGNPDGELMRRKRTLLAWVSIASGGLLLTTLFDLVISAHFILWNWKVVTSVSEWASFAVGAADSFLPSYRVAADVFPIVRAVLEPFGVVLACMAVVVLLRAEARNKATEMERAKALEMKRARDIVYRDPNTNP